MSVGKKEKERVYLDSFLYFCKGLWPDKIISDESPDFVLAIGERRIGIEITEIFVDAGRNPKSRQAVAAARNRITRAARHFAIELCTPPAIVTLFFNGTRPLLRGDESRIAVAVARAIHDDMPPDGDSDDLECRFGSGQPAEVDLIQINRVHPTIEHRWSWTEFSRVERNAVPYVNNAICRKVNVHRVQPNATSAGC